MEKEWVDLGLPFGIKWATCNIGACCPSDYGRYFVWGDTSERLYDSYTVFTHYKGDDGIINYMKYNDNDIDKKTTMELADDAAHLNWGGVGECLQKKNLKSC